MSISFVNAAGANFAGSASMTANIPADVQDGDLLSFWVTTDTAHNSTGTPPSGVDKEGEIDNGTDNSLSVFTKVASGEGSTLAFSSIFDALETGRVIALAHRGVDQVTPMDAAAVFGTESGTAWDSGSITPVTDGAVLVACFACDPASDPYSFTWDGGITERIDADTTPTGQNGTLAYLAIGEREIVTAGSPTTLGGDSGVSDSAATAILALRPAAAEAPVPRHPAVNFQDPGVLCKADRWVRERGILLPRRHRLALA